MKRLLIPIAAAGLFASCVQTETIAPEVGEVQKDVRFNAVVAKKTSRAIITGTEYDKDAPHSVLMHSTIPVLLSCCLVMKDI